MSEEIIDKKGSIKIEPKEFWWGIATTAGKDVPLTEKAKALCAIFA